MKRIVFFCTFFTLLVTFTSCFSQTQNALTFYDADNKACLEKNAQFLSETEKINDSLWQVHYYSIRGPRMQTTSYKDAALTVISGPSILYSEEGLRDSIGWYNNGNLDSSVLYCPDSEWMLKKVYKSGVTLLVDTIWKKYDSTSLKDTASNLRPSFPGGMRVWAKYLNKTLRYPGEAQQYGIQGTVIVKFIVEKDGQTHSFEVIRSANYWLDKETVRIMKTSGKWVPAQKDGEPITLPTMQPLTFRLE